MAKNVGGLKVTIELETLFEGNPVDLEFIKEVLREKRLKDQLKLGCPANNRSCIYLKDNGCSKEYPNVINLEVNDPETGELTIKVVCASFKGKYLSATKGCPTNNTKCYYLTCGHCLKSNPEIICSDFKMKS